MKKYGMVSLGLLILFSAIGYVAFLPKYVCLSVPFDRNYPFDYSPFEFCAVGRVGGKADEAMSFLDKLKSLNRGELKEVFEYEPAATELGYFKARDILLKNFSHEDGKDLELVVELEVLGKKFFSIRSNANANRKLALIVGREGMRDRYYYEFGDDALDGLMAAFSLGDVNYEKYFNWKYVSELVGADSGRDKVWIEGECCFTRLADGVVVDDDPQKSLEYRIFSDLKVGIKTSEVDYEIFYSEGERELVKLMMGSGQSQVRDYWIGAVPKKVYRLGDASVLVVDAGGQLIPVSFVKVNGKLKIFGMLRYTLLNKFAHKNYLNL